MSSNLVHVEVATRTKYLIAEGLKPVLVSNERERRNDDGGIEMGFFVWIGEDDLPAGLVPGMEVQAHVTFLCDYEIAKTYCCEDHTLEIIGLSPDRRSGTARIRSLPCWTQDGSDEIPFIVWAESDFWQFVFTNRLLQGADRPKEECE